MMIYPLRHPSREMKDIFSAHIAAFNCLGKVQGNELGRMLTPDFYYM